MSEINNKSYRIKVKSNATESSKISVKLDRDYSFIEILSLKINQEDFYKLYTSDYGIVVGRVQANGGIGVENAKISVFIPADSTTFNDLEKYLIYPYTTLQTKDINNIRYNLLPSTKLNDCYQVIGTFPSKRFVLDNNSVLEIFDEYYKYTTVTNKAGDYMIYGLPVNNNLLHVDIDLSDIGILSQKPRDMFYKGYNVEQFQSSTQFKTDSNLNNLTQIISQDQNVFVYPFWGDESETNVAITRCDINIQYKFEPTCIFMGSIFTDTQEAGILKNCKVQKAVGRMSSLTTGEGKIEMIRKTFDGIIEEFQIKGNRLIDGDGVFCYQIPMNLDYVTTDEFGNLIPTDNPNKGIPTRAEVRFRLSLDNVGDEGFSKKRGEFLIPHNPQIQNEIDFNFGVTTKDTSFVNLFWNKVYSVKSYIPRLQLINSYRNREFIGIKTINDYGQNNPFPYNTVYITMPIAFNILCLLTDFVINIVSVLNKFLSWLHNLGFLGVHPFRSVNCISVGSGWCTYLDQTLYPGCYGNAARGKYTNTDVIRDCVTTSLADDFNVYNFDFGNDWVNGSIYSPLFQTKIKKKKKRRFLGLFGSRVISETLTFCGLYNNDVSAATNSGFWLWSRGAGNVRLLSNCIVKLISSGDSWSYSANSNSDCKNNNCYKQSGNFPIGQGYINQVTDENNNIHYYYIPAIMRTNNGNPYPVLLYTIDVILLGSMNDCDIDGIFPLHKFLPSTTYQLPSPMYDTGQNVEQSDDPNDPTNTGTNTSTYTEAAGINWGRNGGHRGDDQVTTSGINGRKYEQSSGGLFMGIGCTGSDTYPKSCFNVTRICEVGVSLDESDIEFNSCNTDGIVIAPDGWILKKNELIQSEVRQMFATLNSIPLYNRTNEKNNIISISGKYFYNFKYYYPENFDGKLKYFISNSAITQVNYVNEIKNSDYMDFRFGTNSSQLQYYSPIDYTLPRYINSFYFYFGIRPGKTAIDKFRSGFYSECVSIVKPPFIVQPRVLNGALICACDSSKVIPVIISINIREFIGSYSIQLEDMFGTLYPLTPTPSPELRKTNLIISSSPTYSPQDFYSTILANGGFFYLTIKDENGVNVRREINIPVFGIVNFDYTTESITNNTGDDPNNYIGHQTSLNLLNKGKINISNLSDIAEKGCLLKNYTLSITRQVRTGTDPNTGGPTFGLPSTKIYNSSDPDWLAIANYFDTGAISTSGNVFRIVSGGSGYTAGTVNIIQGTNSTATATITVNSGIIQTVTVVSGGSGYTAGTVNIIQGTNSTATGVLNEPHSFTIYLWDGNYTIILQNNYNCPSSCPCKNDSKEINEVFDVVPPIELIIGDSNIRAKYLTINNISSGFDIWWQNFYQYLTGGDITLNTLKSYYNDEMITSENMADIKQALQNTFISYCSNISIHLTGLGTRPVYKTYLFGKTAIIPIISIDYGGTGYTTGIADIIQNGNDSSENIMIVNITAISGAITQVTSINTYGLDYVNTTLDGLNPISFRQDGSGNNATGKINAPQAQDFLNNNSNPFPVMTNESALDGTSQVVFTCRRLIVNGSNLTLPTGYKMGGYFAGIIGNNGDGNAWNDNFNQYVFDYRNNFPVPGSENDNAIDIFNLYAINSNNWSTDPSTYTFPYKNFVYFQLFDRQLKFYLPLCRITTSKTNYYLYSIDSSTPVIPINIETYASFIYFNGAVYDINGHVINDDGHGNSTLSFVYDDSGGTDANPVFNFVAQVSPNLTGFSMENTNSPGIFLFGTTSQTLPSIRGFNTIFGQNIMPLVYNFTIIDEYNDCEDITISINTVFDLINSKILVIDSGTNDSIPNISNTATFTVTTLPLITSTFYLINASTVNLLPEKILYPDNTFPLTGTINSDPSKVYFNSLDVVEAIYSDLMPTPPNSHFIDRLPERILTNTGITNKIYVKKPGTVTDNINGNVTYSESGMTDMYYVIAVKDDSVRTFSQPINLSYNRIELDLPFVDSDIKVNFVGYSILQSFGYTFKLHKGNYNLNYTTIEADDFFIADSSFTEIVQLVTNDNTYTFNNVSVDTTDPTKIIRISVSNVLGVTHILYTSMFKGISPNDEIACALCNSTGERTYGTRPIGSTNVPTSFVYYTASLDFIGSIQLNSDKTLKGEPVTSGTITKDEFLGLGIGDESKLPDCCDCDPVLSSLSISSTPNTFTPAFNSNTFAYTATYTTRPSGNATATAVIDTTVSSPTIGQVTNITVNNPSNVGYTTAPIVTISAPGGVGNVTATSTAVIDTVSTSPTYGQITAINITNHGSGYTSAPNVTISGGGYLININATISNNNCYEIVSGTGQQSITSNSQQLQVIVRIKDDVPVISNTYVITVVSNFL